MEHGRSLDTKVLLKCSDACPADNPVTNAYAHALSANLNYMADRLESRSKGKARPNLIATFDNQQVRKINSRCAYSNQRGVLIRNGLWYFQELQVLPKRT